MELRSPFSRKREQQTPETEPKTPETEQKTPEQTLTEYLELLLKHEDEVSTVHDDNLVVLRNTKEGDIPEAVVVIDHHRGETDEIAHQSFLVASVDEGRVIWNVHDEKDDPEDFADSPQLFATRIEQYFGDQLEVAKQAQQSQEF